MKAYAVTLFIVQLFALFLIAAAGDGDGNNCNSCNCNPREEFLQCGPHPSCVSTCDNRGMERPCLDICTPGCFCGNGFIRKHENGPCILECDCPIIQ